MYRREVSTRSRAPRLSREQSRARTRDRVLDAATEVFAERGFNGASVEEIAEAAGFSRGAVYSNFADKDELFLAVMDRRTRARIDTVTRLLEEAGNVDSFFSALRADSRRRVNETRLWVLLALEFFLYAMRNPTALPQLTEHHRKVRAALARAVRVVAARSGVEIDLSADRASVILDALDHGLLIEHFTDPKQVPADLYFDVLPWLMRATIALGSTP